MLMFPSDVQRIMNIRVSSQMTPSTGELVGACGAAQTSRLFHLFAQSRRIVLVAAQHAASASSAAQFGSQAQLKMPLPLAAQDRLRCHPRSSRRTQTKFSGQVATIGQPAHQGSAQPLPSAFGVGHQLASQAAGSVNAFRVWQPPRIDKQSAEGVAVRHFEFE
jgi:hypothetical protein